MLVQNLMDQGVSVDQLVRSRSDFAIRAFVNAQELVRFLDQKASLILSAVGILTTALGALMIRALNVKPVTPWELGLRVAIGICILTYMFSAFVVIYAGTKTLMLAVHPLAPNSDAPGLLFPLILLQRYQSNETQYAEKLSNALPSELILDLSSQVMEVSNVYQAKHAHLNNTLKRFRWLSFVWVLTMLLLGLSAVVS